MPINNENYIANKIYESYPSDWNVVELGNLLKRIKRLVYVVTDQEYQEIGIRSHGKGLFYKEPIKGSDLGNKAVFWVNEDCLILNIVFAWEQAVAMTTANEKGMIASHRFPMWQSNGEVDLKYIYNFLLTPLGRHFLELASPGGAGRNKTLGQEEFNRITVCIPRSIEEQKKIIKILENCDKAIELEDQMITLKKCQKRWLKQVLLSGKKRLPGFHGTWDVKKIGDFIKEKSQKNRDNAIDHVVSVTKHKGIVDSLDYFNNHQVFSQDLSTYKTIRKGEYAFPPIHLNEGSIGRLSHINEAVLSPMYTVFKLDESKYNSDLFYNIIKDQTYIKKYQTMVQGSINRRGAISIKGFSAITIITPPLPEQNAIAEILSTADREIDLHEKHLAELKKQKKVLMQLLLTGKVRVKA
jgi:Restriction endonuclease S subunits